MNSRKYYAEADDLIDRADDTADSDTSSDDFYDANFLKSMPDEHGTIAQVTSWLRSIGMRATASHPRWLQHVNFDGFCINKLSINEMSEHMVGWELEIGAVDWLVERIVFARGLRAGVKEYLTHELRQQIDPEYIAAMMAEVKQELRKDIKAVMEEQFDEHVMEEMRNEVIDEVKKEVRQVLKDKFRGSILTHMKYEVMEDMKNDYSYVVSEEPEENGYAEPGLTGRGGGGGQGGRNMAGRKRRKW